MSFHQCISLRCQRRTLATSKLSSAARDEGFLAPGGVTATNTGRERVSHQSPNFTRDHHPRHAYRTRLPHSRIAAAHLHRPLTSDTLPPCSGPRGHPHRRHAPDPAAIARIRSHGAPSLTAADFLEPAERSAFIREPRVQRLIRRQPAVAIPTHLHQLCAELPKWASIKSGVCQKLWGWRIHEGHERIQRARLNIYRENHLQLQCERANATTANIDIGCLLRSIRVRNGSRRCCRNATSQ